MARVLLINPSYEATYGGTKGGVPNPIYPSLGLAAIAGGALDRGHQVEILDLSWRPYDPQLIKDEISKYSPDVIGIYATTPLMNQLRDISVIAKDVSQNIQVVGGGPHVSALPSESLQESMLDAVFVGEADFSFSDYVDSGDPSTVPGIFYKPQNYRPGDEILTTGPSNLIGNLDDLPMPAWHLYDLDLYHGISRLLVKRTPITNAEFSRGCVFKCDFCASKITMGLGYRKKSPERCAEEVARMHAIGFREFWLSDDIFTSDQKWAVNVCKEISRKNVDMYWTCSNGIRVESADRELFTALKDAGCYRVSFGFESGNNEILKSFGKGGQATIEQGKDAVKLARAVGLDTAGTFLMGLSHDTEATMTDTIEYARDLPLDMLKFGVAIAFPGTKMFQDYAKDGLVKSYNWDEYFIYSDELLFAHRHLSYGTIKAFMAKAFKRAVLFNPSFVFRRLFRGIKTGEFFWDFYYAIKFFLAPASRTAMGSMYYAEDRWPKFDFERNVPTEVTYLQVRKSQVKQAS